MWGWRASASGFRPPKSCRLAAAALSFATLAALPSAAIADIYQFNLPDPVTRIVSAADGTFVTLGGESFRLQACDLPEGLCLSTEPISGVPDAAPRGALPDGKIATAGTGDIRRAWYGRPTERYTHGVLGDATEGGSLVVEGGRRGEFVLPETEVFEDITPRIRDLDGDGKNEVVTIRSSQSGGSAVAIYGMRDGELVELGAGSENGRRNRWLNIAGIAGNTIYGVRTPHIGGRLFSLGYENGEFTEDNDIAGDVSNHMIGSRELGLSAMADFDGDGTAELVLPSQDRTRLRFPLSDHPDIALPESIDKAIAVENGRIVTATDSGKLLVIQP